mgnify:CR=1 FL=1
MKNMFFNSVLVAFVLLVASCSKQPELAAALDERRTREAAAVLEKDAALQSDTQPQG